MTLTSLRSLHIFISTPGYTKGKDISENTNGVLTNPSSQEKTQELTDRRYWIGLEELRHLKNSMNQATILRLLACKDDITWRDFLLTAP